MDETYIDVEICVYVVPWSPWKPSTNVGSASANVVSGETRDPIASVGFTWGPAAEASYPYGLYWDCDVDDSSWLIELERPSVSRDFDGSDVEMRLVGAVLKHFSAGRRCWATIVVEPDSWQSRKIDDRNRRRAVLRKYWAQLGFNETIAGTGIVDELRVVRLVNDFAAPAPFDSWGPYTRSVDSKDAE